jgi:virulence-associated protein VapD
MSSQNAKYIDLKKIIKDNNLANSYEDLKSYLINNNFNIDINSVVYNLELLNKSGNNITLSELNEMFKL